MTGFLLYLGGVVSGIWLTCIIVSGGQKRPVVTTPHIGEIDPEAQRAIARLIAESVRVRP